MALETIATLCEGGMLITIIVIIFIFRLNIQRSTAVLVSFLPFGFVAGEFTVTLELGLFD